MSAGELLIVVVDCCTDSWGPIDTARARALEDAEASAAVAESGGTAPPEPPKPARCAFPDFITHLNLFLAAFCALNRRNALAVLGFSDANGGGYIWPRPGDSHHPSTAAHAPTDMLRPAAVGRACEDRLARLRYGDATIDELMGVGGDGEEGADELAAAAERKAAQEAQAQLGSAIAREGISKRHSSLAACLSLALCYNSTQRRLHLMHGSGSARGGSGASGSGSGDTGPLRSRILVFSAGPDRASSHYASTINAIFSAQRFGVPIDAVVLGEHPSSVLQQACDLTRGVYSHPPLESHANSLLFQFLVNAHLPDAATRELLLPAPAHSVDLRASCFCHRRHVSLAHVCSVCLSIWCAPKAICPVCGADTRPAAAVRGQEASAAAARASASASGGAGKA